MTCLSYEYAYGDSAGGCASECKICLSKADKMLGALERALLFAEGPACGGEEAHEKVQVCFADWQDPLRPVGLPQCLPQRSPDWTALVGSL